MKKTLTALTLTGIALLSQTALAAIPNGYYDTLEGKSGVELKEAVKQLILPHEVISYGDPDPNNTYQPVFVATWTVFQESDVRTVDDVLCWWDMYSANNVWVSDGHPGLNIEHSVPNSWWGGKSGSREAYNDLHHLNPSNGDANGQKSNWPLGEIQGNLYWTNGVTTTGTPKTGLGGGATRVFEPYWSYKGDFARAYFYIFTIYDDLQWKTDNDWMYDIVSSLTLKPWAYDMLLTWSAGDVVSYKEIERNEAVYSYQKNRNPFIDCPELAEHIWGAKKNVPFHLEAYTPPVAEPDIYPGWDETFPDMISGRWAPVSSNDDLNVDERYFVVSPTKNRAMTYTLISTNKAIDECFYSPKVDDRMDPARIVAVPDNIATVKLEKDGDEWYVGVYDPDENFKGYISVTSKNSAALSAQKQTSCKARIDVDGANNKTVISYTLSDGTYTLQYNSGNPRFAAYSSSQNPIQLYRATDEVVEDPDAGIYSTGLEENASETIIAIYDINGRKVSATAVEGLEKGIYIVVSNRGTKKIRK